MRRELEGCYLKERGKSYDKISFTLVHQCDCFVSGCAAAAGDRFQRRLGFVDLAGAGFWHHQRLIPPIVECPHLSPDHSDTWFVHAGDQYLPVLADECYWSVAGVRADDLRSGLVERVPGRVDRERCQYCDEHDFQGRIKG